MALAQTKTDSSVAWNHAFDTQRIVEPVSPRGEHAGSLGPRSPFVSRKAIGVFLPESPRTAMVTSTKDTMVETIMSRDLLSVSPDDSVATAMMTAKRCRHLPVFKDGQLDGIVSAARLMQPKRLVRRLPGRIAGWFT